MTIATAPETPAIYDVNGAQRDWPWLVAKYPGTLHRVSTRDAAFRLVTVRETIGPAACVVRVYDQNGAPMAGVVVGLYWSTGTVQVPADNERWYGVVGAAQATDVNGTTGFGLSGGSIYRGDGGPHCAWVLSHLYGSDALDRFGWLGGTNHAGPLSLDFKLTMPTPEPEPPPDEDRPWGEYDLRIGGQVLQVEMRAREP